MLAARPRLAGFSLIEVLVTLVIVSIGLLGLGSLQGYGLSMNGSSHLRLKATYKAYELADRMRANQGALTDATNTGYLTSVTAGNCVSGGAGVVTNCTSSGCTPQQIAVNDLCEWITDLALQLPAGAGTVCVDSTPNDGTPAAPLCDGTGTNVNGMPSVYTVKVWWTDDKSGTPKRFSATVRP